MKRPDNLEDMLKKRADGYYELVHDESWPEETFPDGDLWGCLSTEWAYTNPETGRVDDNESLNTKFEVWLEAGPWMDQSEGGSIPPPEGGWNDYNKWVTTHDTDLDCGGADLETALLKLAVRVKFYYSDDGTEHEPRPHAQSAREERP